MSIDFLTGRNDEENDNRIPQTFINQTSQDLQDWVNQPIAQGSKPNFDLAEFNRHKSQALQLNDRERILKPELKDDLKSISHKHSIANKHGLPYYRKPSNSAIGILNLEKHNLLCKQVIDYSRDNPNTQYHLKID